MVAPVFRRLILGTSIFFLKISNGAELGVRENYEICAVLRPKRTQSIYQYSSVTLLDHAHPPSPALISIFDK